MIPPGFFRRAGAVVARSLLISEGFSSARIPQTASLRTLTGAAQQVLQYKVSRPCAVQDRDLAEALVGLLGGTTGG
jgi:hypothetical protein